MTQTFSHVSHVSFFRVTVSILLVCTPACLSVLPVIKATFTATLLQPYLILVSNDMVTVSDHLKKDIQDRPRKTS